MIALARPMMDRLAWRLCPWGQTSYMSWFARWRWKLSRALSYGSWALMLEHCDVSNGGEALACPDCFAQTNITLVRCPYCSARLRP